MGENKTKGLHDGHRDRVRKRFEENGLEGFYDHQVLEFLLFYGIPRKDTNDIAHNLLNKFGSLSAMFDTTVESLEESGLSYNAAILIKLISEVCARYYQDKYHQKEDDDSNMEDFIIPHFIGRNEEQLFVILLDPNGKMIFCDVISRGVPSASEVNVKKILQLSVSHHARCVVIAHNHPGGIAMPSKEDIKMTESLRAKLKTAGVILLDHYILSDMECRSLSDTEEYEYLFFG